MLSFIVETKLLLIENNKTAMIIIFRGIDSSF